MEAKLDQLACDPLIAPARVLAREPEHKFAQRSACRRPAAFALPIGPLPAHQLAVAAQQRRRCYHESVSARVREQSSKRSDERPIGGSKPRALLLTSQNRKLVPQQHQLHVLGALGPSTPNEQPQNGSESKISEGEEHRQILPGRSHGLWGKETRFGRARRAGGRSVARRRGGEDPRSLPRGFDARLAATVGRDGMVLTSGLSTWLWGERGPALWGPSRACDRCDGGSRNALGWLGNRAAAATPNGSTRDEELKVARPHPPRRGGRQLRSGGRAQAGATRSARTHRPRARRLPRRSSDYRQAR